MNELDRILSADPVVEPSAGFTRRVMTGVRREAAALPPIEFPWRRMTIGLLTCAGLGLVVVLGAMITAGGPAPSLPAAGTGLSDARVNALLIASAALGGSFLVVWAAFRRTVLRGGLTF